MSKPVIRIGIGGWTYEPWRGTFYPDDLPQKRELELAALAFGAIEINATFYSRQSPKSWENWAKAVPDGFQFSVKGSRYVVTRPKLTDAGEGIGNFLAQGLTALRDRLGPILWMLAARRKFDREDIAAFLDLLPAEHDGIPLRGYEEFAITPTGFDAQAGGSQAGMAASTSSQVGCGDMGMPTRASPSSRQVTAVWMSPTPVRTRNAA